MFTFNQFNEDWHYDNNFGKFDFDSRTQTAIQNGHISSEWIEKYRSAFDQFHQAFLDRDLKGINKLKRDMLNADVPPAGPVIAFHKLFANELKQEGTTTSASASRMDRLLRTRSSSGKATPRKF